jgi:hypothetical protein
LPKHEEQSPSRRDFLIQMFEDVYNVYNGFKPLHSSSNSEPLRKAILRARTVVHGFDDMPTWNTLVTEDALFRGLMCRPQHFAGYHSKTIMLAACIR